MQTEKYCYGWETAEPFAANIVQVLPLEEGLAALILDKTIFYPEGGGQGSDRGSINGFEVADVQEKNGAILHTVKLGAAQISAGEAVLILDEKRRADFSAQHTAQHLISGIFSRVLGAPTVSFHLGEETSTLDIDPAALASGICAKTLEEIEELAACEIEADRPVTVHLCPPRDIKTFPLRKPPPEGEGQIRVVEIEGNDFSACGGTHCKSTGRLGLIRLLGAEKHKSLVRVSYIAGRRVLRDSRALREAAVSASRALTVPLFEIGKGALDIMEKAKNAQARLADAREALARFKAASILQKGEGGVLLEVFQEESMEEVLLIAKAVQKLAAGKDAVLIFASKKDLKFTALSQGAGSLDFVKAAFAKTGSGGGGGGKTVFQGGFAKEADLDAFLVSVNG